MITLEDILIDLSNGVLMASRSAPDEYPDFHVDWYGGDMRSAYLSNKEVVLSDWAEARMLLKHDVDKVPLIDTKLQEAFAAFDRGERETGRRLMLEIYGFGLRKLR